MANKWIYLNNGESTERNTFGNTMTEEEINMEKAFVREGLAFYGFILPYFEDNEL